MIEKMGVWWIKCIEHPMCHTQMKKTWDVWWFRRLDVWMFAGMNLPNLA